MLTGLRFTRGSARTQSTARGNFGFLVIMLGSSGLGLAKVMGAAALLPIIGFGHFATLIGIVGLVALLVSMGQLESTVKNYPRLWVIGGREKIWEDARTILSRLTLRVIALAFLVAGLGLFVAIGYDAWTVLLVTLLVINQIWLMLLASIIRAIGSILLLQNFMLLRGGLTCLLVVGTAALTGDWRITLAAELVAAVVISVIAFRWSRRFKSEDLKAKGTGVGKNHGGGKLYAANLLSATISLGDRAFVNGVLGAVVAGVYGVIALLIQIGTLFVGAITQKVGAQIIKAVHTGETRAAIVRSLTLPLALTLLCAAMVAMLLFAGREMAVVEQFLVARGIGTTLILLALAALVSQFYLIMEFALIAYDQEAKVLQGSALAATLCYGGFFAAMVMGWPLEIYVGSIALARFVQCVWLGMVLLFMKIASEPEIQG